MFSNILTQGSTSVYTLLICQAGVKPWGTFCVCGEVVALQAYSTVSIKGEASIAAILCLPWWNRSSSTEQFRTQRNNHPLYTAVTWPKGAPVELKCTQTGTDSETQTQIIHYYRVQAFHAPIRVQTMRRWDLKPCLNTTVKMLWSSNKQ